MFRSWGAIGSPIFAEIEGDRGQNGTFLGDFTWNDPYDKLYRVSDKKSYSSFWLVFKNACANLIQTFHGHSLKDGKNHSHKSKQLGRVTTSGMRFA